MLVEPFSSEKLFLPKNLSLIVSIFKIFTKSLFIFACTRMSLLFFQIVLTDGLFFENFHQILDYFCFYKYSSVFFQETSTACLYFQTFHQILDYFCLCNHFLQKNLFFQKTFHWLLVFTKFSSNRWLFLLV